MLDLNGDSNDRFSLDAAHMKASDRPLILLFFFALNTSIFSFLEVKNVS